MSNAPRCPTCGQEHADAAYMINNHDAPKPETQAEQSTVEFDKMKAMKDRLDSECTEHCTFHHDNYAALADALAEKERAHAETRGLVRDLTTALENRNRENASLLKRATEAEERHKWALDSIDAWADRARALDKDVESLIQERNAAIKRAEAAERALSESFNEQAARMRDIEALEKRADAADELRSLLELCQQRRAEMVERLVDERDEARCWYDYAARKGFVANRPPWRKP